MVDHLTGTPGTDDGESSIAPKNVPTEWFSPVSLLPNPLYSEMSLPVLAAHCMRELSNYRRGEICTDSYGLELLRRATVQGDQHAWAWVHHCFDDIVLNWLRRHPNRCAACRLDSEQNYVAQAFERFWQATASNQRMQFSTLAAALQYLRVSLNGAILDTLRAYARPREISLLEPGEAGEPNREDSTDSGELWDILKTLLSNPREQRLAYLFFHCGLKPREIVHFCPQEFSNIREVYSLRRTINDRWLRNAHLLDERIINST